tara:strand:+ start:230 stop:661 length:432 start_codon:yes stop_codon:yes gene_type:complete
MRLLTLLSICLFLSNCSDKKPVQNEIVVEVEEKQQRVFFKWPKDGSTVASPVFIDMGVEGMIVEPAGVVKEGYGHHHILINQSYWPEGEVIPTSDSTLHYGKGQTDASIELEPGKYIISLQFADGVHASFGEKMASSVEINVE